VTVSDLPGQDPRTARTALPILRESHNEMDHSSRMPVLTDAEVIDVVAQALTQRSGRIGLAVEIPT
jgi:hypothetical protein